VTGALLYLPKEWLSDRDRRTVAHIPAGDGLPGEVASGAHVDPTRARRRACRSRAVLADAEFGDVTGLQASAASLAPAVCGRGLASSHGVSRDTRRPRPAEWAPGPARDRKLVLVHDTRPIAVRALALALPARAWRRVTWRNGMHRPWAPASRPVRVTPAHDWRDRRLAPEVWLLCEQISAPLPRIKYFFVNLPPSASVKQLVRLAHQRWAIEQQYQELKTELGFDHFEGRSYPGWQHHVVLSAVAYAFLQRERMRLGTDPALTFPGIRAIVQEIFTALLFAQQPDYFKRIQELQQIKPAGLMDKVVSRARLTKEVAWAATRLSRPMPMARWDVWPAACQASRVTGRAKPRRGRGIAAFFVP
jgi:SRSO17 transposase